MGQSFEFTMTVYAPQGIDPNLATDEAVRAIGKLGYMVDITHKPLDCTAAVAAAVAEEREACAVLANIYFPDGEYIPAARRAAIAIATLIRARSRASGGNG